MEITIKHDGHAGQITTDRPDALAEGLAQCLALFKKPEPVGIDGGDWWREVMKHPNQLEGKEAQAVGMLEALALFNEALNTPKAERETLRFVNDKGDLLEVSEGSSVGAD
jgi:hypothetical protein